MRGIVKAQAGPGLEFRTDLPMPEINADEVLLKIRCASICGTDLGIYDWGAWARRRMHVFPRIIGHETTGEIVAVGKNVRDRFVGQRVSCETHMWDGTCPHCLAGRRHVCQNMTLYGIQTDGAFAEYSKSAPTVPMCSTRRSPTNRAAFLSRWARAYTASRRRMSPEKQCWLRAVVRLA